MANLDMTVEDIQELFRVMPEAYKEMQIIIQRRVISVLELEIEGIKENPNGNQLILLFMIQLFHQLLNKLWNGLD